MPNASPALPPAMDFLQAFWRLDHAIEKLSSRTQAALGVTAQQRLMIRCLGHFGSLGSGQLAAMLHVDPGTVSAALRRLEAKKLVRRRGDPHDGRRTIVTLTAQGKRLDRPIPGTLESGVERLLGSTPPEHIELWTTLMASLTRILEAEVRNERPGSGALWP